VTFINRDPKFLVFGLFLNGGDKDLLAVEKDIAYASGVLAKPSDFSTPLSYMPGYIIIKAYAICPNGYTSVSGTYFT
jgi:hypothetical protein